MQVVPTRRAVFVAALLAAVPTALHAAGPILFNRDVRPILADKCWRCHGPDATSKGAPMRLDIEADAKADHGGRRAIVPGDVAASELVKRITATSKAKLMPPAWSNLALSPQEIETLRAWIASGAEWQRHWSFLPPQRPALPAVNAKEWTRNPIDAFILARLEREGLRPAPEASRATLLRRVSLDLTGLPPTLAELDAFLADNSPDAYEKVVERLLASPRYAERMASDWLDAARYADTNGYQYDGVRQMWRWRDWVIDAFRANKPFDRFVIEQLAGDLLPNATLDQKIATGFSRNHRINTEDGIIPAEYAVEYVVDRVETTSAVFLGLTLGCARCHNHKYDPIPQKDFYRFFAYFNNVPELGRGMKYGNSPPRLAAPTLEQQRELAALDSRMELLRQSLAKLGPRLRTAQIAWEKTTAPYLYWVPRGSQLAAGSATDGEVQRVAGRVSMAYAFDGKAWLDAGPDLGAFDIDDRFTLAFWVNPASADGSLVTRMVDKPEGKGYGIHLNKGHLHVNVTSNYADDAIRLETAQTLDSGRWYHVAVSYDGTLAAGAPGVQVYIDGQPAPVTVLLDTLYRPFRNAGKKFDQPLRIGAGWGPEKRFRGMIDDVRVWARVLSPREVSGAALGVPATRLVRIPAPDRTPLEAAVLRETFLDDRPPLQARELWQELKGLEEKREALTRTFPTVMVMADLKSRRQTHLLKRGAYDQPTDPVEPGVPSALPPLPPNAPANRLGLAQWLVSPENPLLARVTVNRYWQSYFGTGIVKTVEDFGSQGEWPSHPELLDWLATEFIRTGWDVKAMQRLIVTSAAYRQSSRSTPELLQRDPDNRLLARGPRFRLPAVMVRDQALALAGLLAEKQGGPSVMPYQPEGLWGEVSMQDMDYVQSHGPDLYRRSIYTFWKRTIAPPMMVNFDAAHRESCVVRASRTNTPLQALNLMNDVTFLEAARVIGQRMIKEGGADPAARLRYGFRLIMAREPKPAEEQVLLDSLHFHLDHFADSKKSDAWLGYGESPVDPSLNRREIAAYGAVASLLLNLDEALVKE